VPTSQSAPAENQAALPSGYRAFDSGSSGFRLALAPGWSGPQIEVQSTILTDPSGRGRFLIHYESATTQDLDAAAAIAMIELTGGTGGARTSSQDTVVAGLRGRQIIASFLAGGAVARIEVYVMVDPDRFWFLALASPQEVFDSDRVDFERMVLSFGFKVALPVPEARVALGRPAPVFDLRGPAGSRLVLAAVRGPVVVNFFASWCPSCREEMPMLQARVDRSNGRFTVMGITVHDDTIAVPGFIREAGVRFPVGYDTSGETASRYVVGGVPATFFLDARHVLRQTVIGPLTADSLERGLKSAGAA
jgi:thiol-disulfide isomerase/thioredoxin